MLTRVRTGQCMGRVAKRMSTSRVWDFRFAAFSIRFPRADQGCAIKSRLITSDCGVTICDGCANVFLGARMTVMRYVCPDCNPENVKYPKLPVCTVEPAGRLPPLIATIAFLIPSPPAVRTRPLTEIFVTTGTI